MAVVTEKPTTENRQSWLQTVVRFREAGIIVIILLLSVLVTLRSPAFLTLDNLRDILLTISILVIVALGQTMVIITRGIDLSVGSMIGLTAMIVSFFMVNFPETPPALAVLLGMGIGVVLGGINGVVISYAGVPPIIATLGTLSIYRGLVFWYSEGDWVNAFEMPQAFRDLAKASPLGVPNLIIFAVVVAVAIYLFLNYTRMGRNIYAVGSNPDAARFAGIPIQRVIFTVYLISGLLCGLAGVLWASRFEAAQTNTALGFELQTVAAPVVGGVNIFGGSGSVVSVLLGAFLLGIINNALTLVRISPFWQLAAQGLLILGAVVADAAIMRRLQTLTGKSRTS
jgi:rhamnose transport system permease protein